MRKLIGIIAAFVLIGLTGCLDDSTWEEYEAWRNDNKAFFQNVTENKEFTAVTPKWNPGVYIMKKTFVNGTGTVNPNLTSTVAVKYKGFLANGVAFDSSYNATDSLFVTSLQSVIRGWQIGLENMVVGDSCQLVIPADLGYGSEAQYGSYSNVTIPPYSTLIFNIKLVSIPALEKPNK